VVKTSDEDVVIKYLWNDGLKADGDAELYPVDVAEGIQFIGIHTGGRKEINLSYHVWK
jgi:hypothetical protein